MLQRREDRPRQFAGAVAGNILMRTDGVQRRKLLAAEIDRRGTTLREPAARPRIDRAPRITLDQIARPASDRVARQLRSATTYKDDAVP
jgi:hypothetical protein